MPNASDPRYLYDRHGIKASRVGQAVIDILSHDQPIQTAGDTIEAFGPEYTRQIEEAVNNGIEQRFQNPFYILVLTKKELSQWTANAVRNYFVTRQTPPHALELAKEYENHTKTLYLVDAEKGNIGLLWSIPGHEECKSIARHPRAVAPELIGWIKACYEGKLEKDKYAWQDVYVEGRSAN